jgi:hypothetical protein
MKKLLFLIVAIVVFGMAVNAQSIRGADGKRPNLSGLWKATDNPNPSRIVQPTGSEGRAPVNFTLGESHIGAGYWVSPTQVKLIQTFAPGGGCSVDMYLVFTVKSGTEIDLTFEFLESKCGFTKGAKGTAKLIRIGD